MRHTTGLVYALLCITICHNVVLSVPVVVKRQADFSDLSEQEKSWDTQFQDENIPVEGGDREKRKIPFELKNAVLGLIFGKINSFIDTKTQLLNTLDRTNIEKNKQLGIEAPKSGNGLAAITGAIGSVINSKIQFIAPKIQAISGLVSGKTSLLGGLSGGFGGFGGQAGGSTGAGGASVSASASVGGSGGGLGSLIGAFLGGSSGGNNSSDDDK